MTAARRSPHRRAPARPARLTPKQLAAALARLPGWSVADGKLHKTYKFADFVEAWGFMNKVALVAQSMDHHPDWSNAYRTVVINLVTHSAGGITNKDVELATRIEELA